MYDKVIRDNVHGDIHFFEPLFMELINTPEMQRLRRISQLGGATLAYPSATHSRFSHSLGVYQLLLLFFQAPDFQKISASEKRLTLVAGLLHDIGHGPFSHSFEPLTQKNHEEYTAEMIQNPQGKIASVLKKYGLDPQEIVQILTGNYPRKILSLLVSSQLDADRLDYLMRDSYHAGVDYALLDSKWIVRHASIKDDRIFFPYKTLQAIESYLLGRYHMYLQVYNHPTSIAFDSLFYLWFKRLKELLQANYSFSNPDFRYYFESLVFKQNLPLALFLELDDSVMINLFRKGKKELDPIFQDLSGRLLERRLFKVVRANQVNKKQILALLKQKGWDFRYYFDEYVPRKLTIYQNEFFQQKDETIWIEDYGVIKPLSELSIFADSMTNLNDDNNHKKLLFPRELV